MSEPTIPSARQLRAIRAWAGVSQTDAAKRAGVSLSTVLDFETGKRATSPDSRRAIGQFCRTLEIQWSGADLVLPE